MINHLTADCLDPRLRVLRSTHDYGSLLLPFHMSSMYVRICVCTADVTFAFPRRSFDRTSLICWGADGRWAMADYWVTSVADRGRCFLDRLTLDVIASWTASCKSIYGGGSNMFVCVERPAIVKLKTGIGFLGGGSEFRAVSNGLKIWRSDVTP